MKSEIGMRYRGMFVLSLMAMLAACSVSAPSEDDDELAAETSSSKKYSSSSSKDEDSSDKDEDQKSSAKETSKSSSSKSNGKSSSSKAVDQSSNGNDSEKSSSSKASSSSSKENSSSSVKSSSSSTKKQDDECVGEIGNPWDGTTAKAFACGAGTKLKPYIILTAEQLAKLSFAIGASDADYQGKYFKLGADIILNKGKIIDDKGVLVADSTKLHKWTPIGNSSVAFTGTFDGDGHAVRGMFINTTSTHNGLFGNVSGTVQNVTVADSWVSGGKYTAGVVGVLVGSGIVKNVENKASVIGLNEVTVGIVSLTSYEYSKKVTIENVKNYGFVQGTRFVAGIVGSSDNGLILKNVVNYGSIESQNSAGGVGCHLGSGTDVDHAENYGNVQGKEYVAGVASYFGSGYCVANKNYGTLKNAVNGAFIQGNKYVSGIVGQAQCITIEKSINKGVVEGKNMMGGICGHCQRSLTKSVYNKGKVFGDSYVGGIVGFNEEGVTSSVYSTGKVDGDSLVGLMIGYNYNTTMADYYYLKQGDQEPFGQNNGGGVATPKSADEMKSQNFAELLGDDFIYDSGLNDGYPVLKWENL